MYTLVCWFKESKQTLIISFPNIDNPETFHLKQGKYKLPDLTQKSPVK